MPGLVKSAKKHLNLGKNDPENLPTLRNTVPGVKNEKMDFCSQNTDREVNVVQKNAWALRIPVPGVGKNCKKAFESRENVPKNLLTFYGIQYRGVKNEKKDFYSQKSERGE